MADAIILGDHDDRHKLVFWCCTVPVSHGNAILTVSGIVADGLASC